MNVKAKYIRKFATEHIYFIASPTFPYLLAYRHNFSVHKLVTSSTEQIMGFGMRTLGFYTVKKKASVNTFSPNGVILLRDLSRHQS
jgi:hypothetical protein